MVTGTLKLALFVGAVNTTAGGAAGSWASQAWVTPLAPEVANLENIRRQYRELKKIQSVLKEEPTVINYLNTKELIESHHVTEKARDFKKEVFEHHTAQSTLFDSD